MAKKRNFRKSLAAVSIWEWVNIIGVIALVVACVNYFNQQMAEMHSRTQSLEEAIRRLDKTMDEVKLELRKTSDLLNADLSWRYLYQNHPTAKNLVPKYDPYTRTLELVDTITHVPNLSRP